MNVRPIIMSGPMIRALLEGRKTQTRRIAKPQPIWNGTFWNLYESGWSDDFAVPAMPGHSLATCNPYGTNGDLLWVRERFIPDPPIDGWSGDIEWNGCGRPIAGVPTHYRSPKNCIFHATWEGSDLNWDSPIYMPRWASRLTLELTSVHIERARNISSADALAEGIYFDKIGYTAGYIGKAGINQEWSATPEIAFFNLFRAVNGKDSLEANPWCWALTFQVHQQNVDAFLKTRGVAA
jgi:hypothetical protein